MAREFEGLTALVTGSSNGIGAEAAVKFAEQGAAEVLVQYHRAQNEAAAVCDRIRAAGAKAEMFGADLSDMSGINGFVSEIGTGGSTYW